jgi:tripartite-type tricarboxylate transporter receptor subunit TctC
MNFPSAGNGSTIHLAGEIFKSMAGVDLVHVPYKGMGPGLTDLYGGRLQLTFAPLINVLQPAKNGQVRMLGISSMKRSPLAPDLPTINEAGVKGYDVAGWFGVVAPAGTPRALIDRVNREIVQILRSKAVTDRLVNEGAEVGGNTPAEFAAVIKADLAKWGKAVRDAKVTLQ